MPVRGHAAFYGGNPHRSHLSLEILSAPLSEEKCPSMLIRADICMVSSRPPHAKATQDLAVCSVVLAFSIYGLV